VRDLPGQLGPKEVCMLFGKKSSVNERTPEGPIGASCDSTYRTCSV
jgi:hypothetical protein